jgi:hypothetical protein
MSASWGAKSQGAPVSAASIRSGKRRPSASSGLSRRARAMRLSSLLLLSLHAGLFGSSLQPSKHLRGMATALVFLRLLATLVSHHSHLSCPPDAAGAEKSSDPDAWDRLGDIQGQREKMCPRISRGLSILCFNVFCHRSTSKNRSKSCSQPPNKSVPVSELEHHVRGEAVA